VPSDHIILEFQSGLPIATANRPLNDAFNSEVQLCGKRGGYIERVRSKAGNGATIFEVREETERRVHDGELDYKETLLGGCLKPSTCEHAMLGDCYNCIGRDDSVVKRPNLEAEIELMEAELKQYKVGSGEYQVTYDTLSKLSRTQKITASLVSKEAGLDGGYLKAQRHPAIFAEIAKAQKEQQSTGVSLEKFNEQKRKAKAHKDDAITYKQRLDDLLGRELRLLARVIELERKLAQSKPSNILVFPSA
jgi:hypothetical protein